MEVDEEEGSVLLFSADLRPWFCCRAALCERFLTRRSQRVYRKPWTLFIEKTVVCQMLLLLLLLQRVVVIEYR